VVRTKGAGTSQYGLVDKNDDENNNNTTTTKIYRCPDAAATSRRPGDATRRCSDADNEDAATRRTSVNTAEVPHEIAAVATPAIPPRAQITLAYLNSISLTGRALSYTENVTAEGRTVQWLVDNDLGTAPSNEQSLRLGHNAAPAWAVRLDRPNGNLDVNQFQ
jgi:hypothetical protein